MNLKFNVEQISYNGTKEAGIIIGTYTHKWKLKYHPLFACLLKNKGTISKTTRQKNGVVYIPLSELHPIKKLKIVSGKDDYYTYRILRNIKIEAGGYLVTCEATDYNRDGKIEFNEQTKGAKNDYRKSKKHS